jgi:predicted DNA-binding transcriptional regulator AlpA
MTPPRNDDDVLMTSAAVRARLGGISDMSLFRWRNDPKVAFPPPDFRISRRVFWKRATIEKWLATRAVGGA